MGKLVPVESTSIAAIGYNPRTRQLGVQFRDSGAVYRYLDVPPSVFAELMAAPSKGRSVNFEIKPNYRCEKVRAARPVSPRTGRRLRYGSRDGSPASPGSTV
jgi:KTSC domain